MPKLLKIVGLLVGVVLAAEVFAGYLNFQRGSERGSGLAWLADRVETRLRSPETRGVSLHGVYQPEFSDLRRVLAQSYTAEFDAFMLTARERSCGVAMLYIPTNPSYPAARELFAALAERASIPFIDMEPVKERYSPDQLYLIPGDTHPSRLLGQLTATAMAEPIQRLAEKGCEGSRATGLEGVGPWVKNLSELRETAKGLAFRFTSDGLGFRSTGYDATGEDDPSVLLIGDSFTFGTSLSDQDSWPAFLQRQVPRYRMMNAGVGGISIVRQHEILKAATQDGQADIIVLQVNETDLQGLTPAYWPEMKSPPVGADEIAGFFR